jgi:HD-like signal output (HDOD) protein
MGLGFNVPPRFSDNLLVTSLSAASPPLTQQTDRLSADQKAAHIGEVIRRTVTLPTMPQVAQRVLAILENPKSSPAEIARSLEIDPGIAGQIMKVVNSSFYGLPRKVQSLQQAVTLLGCEEIKNLVVAAASRSLFRRFEAREQTLWLHALRAAVISRTIATYFAPKRREVAFLAGQMHDVGTVVLNANLPHVNLPTGAHQEPAKEAELEVYGFTHSDVGALLMQDWNMPPEIEAAAFFHHDVTLAASIDPEVADVVSIVALSDVLAHGSVEEAALASEDTAQALEILQISAAHFPKLSAEWREKAHAETAQLFSTT